MGNPSDPMSMRFPPRIDEIIREFARKNGFTLRQATSFLIAKGYHSLKSEKEFRIEEYITSNFFEDK